MTDDGRIHHAARSLVEEHQARKPFGHIPETWAPRAVDGAYAVQEAFHTRLAKRHGPVDSDIRISAL